MQLCSEARDLPNVTNSFAKAYLSFLSGVYGVYLPWLRNVWVSSLFFFFFFILKKKKFLDFLFFEFLSEESLSASFFLRHSSVNKGEKLLLIYSFSTFCNYFRIVLVCRIYCWGAHPIFVFRIIHFLFHSNQEWKRSSPPTSPLAIGPHCKKQH
jgi:hypothetical protein